MKAIIFTQYGTPEVLQAGETTMPALRDNEIMVAVHAVSVNFGDLLARNFREVTPENFSMPLLFWLPAKLAFGFYKPRKKILGNEFSGIVEKVGKQVTKFKPGDEVFGYLGMNMGAYAEYISVPEKSCIALKPQNLSFEEAAAMPYGALMAVELLKNQGIEKNKKVMIVGASGGIGKMAVQMAAMQGAVVTGVCGTSRMEMVKNLGAAKVLDYTQTDYTLGKEKYDLIIDIPGRTSFKKCRNILADNGKLMRVSFKTRHLIHMLLLKFRKGKKLVCKLAAESQQNLEQIALLAEKGLIKSVVNQIFPYHKAADAHRCAEHSSTPGSVVIVFKNVTL